jgi:hypothetical protein
MPYRIKLPPDVNKFPKLRLPSSPRSGDSGDNGVPVDTCDIPEAQNVPAPSVCLPLPKGVRLISYKPKTPPLAIELISVVTNVDKFLRHYLGELDARLNRPLQIRAGGSVFEILSKLAEVGLEVTIDAPQRGEPKGDPAR